MEQINYSNGCSRILVVSFARTPTVAGFCLAGLQSHQLVFQSRQPALRFHQSGRNGETECEIDLK
jgi:hypothetical protein